MCYHVCMVDVKEEALHLRQKGFSYNEICAQTRIAKSTLYGWLRDVPLSRAARDRLVGRVREGTLHGLVKRNKAQTIFARERADKSQNAGIERVTSEADELLLVGAVLYWAEGYKRLKIRNGASITSHPISFVNADPDMIAIFLHFLVHSLGVAKDDIWAAMRLYPQMDEATALRYWSRMTGMNRMQFKKTTWMISGASRGKRPQDRLPHGTLQIGVNDTEKFHHLLGLIEGVKKRMRVL